MRKAAEAVRLVMKNMFYMGFTGQICMGLVWMAGNFPVPQDFPPAEEGVYALVAGAVGEAGWLVCLLQISLVLYAGCRLLEKLRVDGEKMRVWGSLALMTLPMAAQCHMALLPYSLICSTELLKLSFVCEAAGEEADCCGKELTGILVCFGAQLLLWPGYWVPGAVLPLLMLLWKGPGMLRHRKGRLGGCALILCFAVAVATGYGIQRAEDGDGAGNWRWTLVKRVCWPTLWVDSDGMPEGIRNAVQDVVWVSAYYPSHMDLYFKPAVDREMTQEETEAALWQMTVQSWRAHYPLIIRQIGWDVLGYSVTPLILPQQLEGTAYDSCSGRNYEIMRNRMPVFTKYYVGLACRWYAVSLGIALIAAVMSRIAQPGGLRDAAGHVSPDRKLRRQTHVSTKHFFVPLLAVLFSAASAVLFFTMRGAGIMDYKYTVWVNQLWILFGILGVSEEGGTA